ncbi:sortase B protein-sorting domain-containing protein [Prevotella melaninogenica]|nr:sortase B protein-sorting domain-containing protein [Prevotella melaninogenica]
MFAVIFNICGIFLIYKVL